MGLGLLGPRGQVCLFPGWSLVSPCRSLGTTTQTSFSLRMPICRSRSTFRIVSSCCRLTPPTVIFPALTHAGRHAQGNPKHTRGGPDSISPPKLRHVRRALPSPAHWSPAPTPGCWWPAAAPDESRPYLLDMLKAARALALSCWPSSPDARCLGLRGSQQGTQKATL